jgi:hypothetical protein
MSEISFRLLSKPFRLLLRKFAFSFQLPVDLKMPDSEIRMFDLFPALLSYYDHQITIIMSDNCTIGVLLLLP